MPSKYTRKKKHRFMKFRPLREMLTASEARQVKEILELLEDRWRDDLTDAIIIYLKTGRCHDYSDSRLMEALQRKIINLITN